MHSPAHWLDGLRLPTQEILPSFDGQHSSGVNQYLGSWWHAGAMALSYPPQGTPPWFQGQNPPPATLWDGSSSLYHPVWEPRGVWSMLFVNSQFAFPGVPWCPRSVPNASTGQVDWVGRAFG